MSYLFFSMSKRYLPSNEFEIANNNIRLKPLHNIKTEGWYEKSPYFLKNILSEKLDFHIENIYNLTLTRQMAHPLCKTGQWEETLL